MAELSVSSLAEVVEACRGGAAEAAKALKRGIDLDASLTVGIPAQIDPQNLPLGFDGPGLVVVLTVGKLGVLVVLPRSSGMVPDWTSQPDATGQSRLSTLAQELGTVLLPERYAPDDFQAGIVKSVAGALTRGRVASGAALVPLELKTAGGASAVISLIWPAMRPKAVLAAGSIAGTKPTAGAVPLQGKPALGRAAGGAAAGACKSPVTASFRPGRPPSLDDLPSYSRSLLRIQTPVIVTLARKRQQLKRILELGPGSIIQFDKSCEEMLDLEVGGRVIATGEAVKVGEKFGLRIHSIVLPEERFRPVKGEGKGERRE